MPAYSCMCLIDAGLLLAYAILITRALAGMADILRLSGSQWNAPPMMTSSGGVAVGVPAVHPRRPAVSPR
jgi:hypothetical protein